MATQLKEVNDPGDFRSLAAEYCDQFVDDENDLERRLYLSEFVLWMESQKEPHADSSE